MRISNCKGNTQLESLEFFGTTLMHLPSDDFSRTISTVSHIGWLLVQDLLLRNQTIFWAKSNGPITSSQKMEKMYGTYQQT